VALGTLPDIASTGSPLAAAAALVVGTAGALVMSVGAMISILGNIGSSAFAGPRYLFALARDGFGPARLARVQPRFRTPATAILTHIAIAWGLALSGSFVQLAMLSVIARLSTYIGTAAALPVLRRRFGDRPGALRLPGGSTIPVVALLLSVALLASARTSNLLAAGAALIIGAALYPFARPPMSNAPSAAHPDGVE
jgi:basic amino acid/polyamine antiporter, APA family